MIDIENCPFCGSFGFLKEGTTPFVVCSNPRCLACGPDASSPEEAWRLWNKREEFVPCPGSLWLVHVEGRPNVVTVCSSGKGFYIPGQEPCWPFSHVDKWIREVVV